MIFSSVEFLLVFLPLTALLYGVARRGVEAAWGPARGLSAGLFVLTVGSVVFYGIWNPSLTLLLLASVLFNHALARVVEPGSRRGAVALAVGVVGNLAPLFWFKYAAFAGSIAADLGLIDRVLQKQVLPLGISFFTFVQIAYLVDRRRGTAPRRSLLNYLLFVSFFPHLIAGPIVHHAQMMPQLDRARMTWGGAALALFILAIGLAKKTILADALGEHAAPGFADPHALGTLNAWSVVLAYTFQLYFDFSGYSDMAVGLALLFGVRLPWNFLSPYRAASPTEFWRRWHITLSDFLRDYVYIPLGGSRRGRARTSINLLITLLLGGIWHGAGWTYILWGAVHGVALAINHLARPLRLPIPRLVGWALTMTLVVAGWVLFRSTNLHDAAAMYAALLGHGHASNLGDHSMHAAAPFIVIAALVAMLCPSAAALAERFRPTLPWALLGMALMSLSILAILGQFTPPEFLYFEF